MLLGVVFVVVMGVFIKCCAVHTPSSNPHKPPARSITDTLRRPVNTLRRVKVKYLTFLFSFPPLQVKLMHDSGFKLINNQVQKCFIIIVR